MSTQYYAASNKDKFYFSAIIEHYYFWKEIRNNVKMLKLHISNIEDKWYDFEDLVTTITTGTIVFMGSLTKDKAVPDETITSPSPNVSNEKVFDCVTKAQELGLILNPNKIYQPVTFDNIQMYNKELNEAVDNWVAIASLYIKIFNIYYKVNMHRNSAFETDMRIISYFSPNYRLTNLDSSKTPGQLALNYPHTSSLLQRTDSTHFFDERVKTEFGDEYYNWLYRQLIEMVQEEPEKMTFRIVKINDITMAGVNQSFAPQFPLKHEISNDLTSQWMHNVIASRIYDSSSTYINESSDPRIATKITAALDDDTFSMIGIQAIFCELGGLRSEMMLGEYVGVGVNDLSEKHKLDITVEPKVQWVDDEPDPPAMQNSDIPAYDFSTLNIYAIAVKRG